MDIGKLAGCAPGPSIDSPMQMLVGMAKKTVRRRFGYNDDDTFPVTMKIAGVEYDVIGMEPDGTLILWLGRGKSMRVKEIGR